MYFSIVLAVSTLLIVIFGPSIIISSYYYKKESVENRKLLRARLRKMLVVLNFIMVIFLSIISRYFHYSFHEKSFIPCMLVVLCTIYMIECALMFMLGSHMLVEKLKEKFHKIFLSTDDVPYDASKREFIRNGILFPSIAVVSCGYGAWERMQTKVNEYQIPCKNLPEAINGLKIAQISDVHLGMFFSKERLEELIKQVLEIRPKPEILAMTGDIFDSKGSVHDALMVLDKYQKEFPRGVYFCYGNHEYYMGIREVEEGLEKSKIIVLRNSSILIHNDSSHPLYLLGVDYPVGARGDAFYHVKQDYIERAMQHVPKHAIKILLGHHPEVIDDGFQKDCLLTLTGHTHGGQFGFFGYSLFPIFKYNRGMIQTEDGKFGYVHVGNGSWFPFRFGCMPEIACFTIVKA